MSFNFRQLCFAALLVTTSSALLTADVIDLDFGRLNNVAASGNYNNTGTGNSGNVVDNTAFSLVENVAGAATGITLTINPDGATAGEPTAGSHAGAGADFGGPYPSAFSSVDSAVLTDSIFIREAGTPASATSGARVEFLLTGLDAGSTYDIELYGARGGTVGGNVHFFVSDDGGATFSTDSFNVLGNETSFSTFSGLAGTGDISIIATTQDNDAGAINFGRITVNAIPEPATGSLLAIVSIGCLIRRRKGLQG